MAERDSAAGAAGRVSCRQKGWVAAGLSLLLLTGLARAGDFDVLAPGAYRYDGAALAAAVAPAGDAGNVGLLVGTRAALLIDTGASYLQGREVLAALRRVTALPVTLALISHTAPEFLFGAGALQDAGIAIYAQRPTSELIAQRCTRCLENARATYGEAALAMSRVPVADRVGEGTFPVELGGRSVQVLDFGWAGMPGELAVFDPANHVLFAGGLVEVGRVPVIRDADLGRWIAALDQIAKLPIRFLVPGHGPVAGPEAAAAQRAYLVELDAAVRRRYAEGLSLAATVAAATLPVYAGWVGYPAVHQQNVHHLYLAIEREELAAAAAPARQSP